MQNQSVHQSASALPVFMFNLKNQCDIFFSTYLSRYRGLWAMVSMRRTQENMFWVILKLGQIHLNKKKYQKKYLSHWEHSVKTTTMENVAKTSIIMPPPCRQIIVWLNSWMFQIQAKGGTAVFGTWHGLSFSYLVYCAWNNTISTTRKQLLARCYWFITCMVMDTLPVVHTPSIKMYELHCGWLDLDVWCHTLQWWKGKARVQISP